MALYQLQRLDDALAAYSRGLQLDDMNPSCIEGMDKLQTKLAEIARREVRHRTRLKLEVVLVSGLRLSRKHGQINILTIPFDLKLYVKDIQNRFCACIPMFKKGFCARIRRIMVE